MADEGEIPEWATLETAERHCEWLLTFPAGSITIGAHMTLAIYRELLRVRADLRAEIERLKAENKELTAELREHNLT